MAKQTKSTAAKAARKTTRKTTRKPAPKAPRKAVAKPARTAVAKPAGKTQAKGAAPTAPKGAGKNMHVLERLFEVVKKRCRANPDSSYTARLYARGRAQVAKKVGEEAVEVAIAALVQDKKALIAESGDLLFHLLVLWAEVGVKPEQAWRELERRFGISGITEKRQRRG